MDHQLIQAVAIVTTLASPNPFGEVFAGSIVFSGCHLFKMRYSRDPSQPYENHGFDGGPSFMTDDPVYFLPMLKDQLWKPPRDTGRFVAGLLL
jgi:hypothetical protein